ncbi:MAG: hypothetical protein WHS86_07445 [Desulfosoma sp.]
MQEEVRHDAAFMGKITAGATHELKNVLAIVGESAGLLEDLLQAPSSRDFPHRERILKALTSIRDQVRRGTHILTQLNRFAHGADSDTASVRLGDVLENLKALSDRFLRQKALSLTLSGAPGADQVAVQACPVSLQRLLFTGLMALAQEVPQGETLCIETGAETDGLWCRLSRSKGALEEEAVGAIRRIFEDESAAALREALSADVRVSRDGVLVRLPRSG